MNDRVEKCPYCSAFCDADWVDVGVGLVQCGPFHCDQCLASEIGPYDAPRDLSEQERSTGWYAPGAEPGSSANVVGGKVVSAEVMKATYRAEFTRNPLWEDKAHVDQWWAETRRAKA